MREGSLVECIICQISFNSAMECIDHLAMGHFKDEILSGKIVAIKIGQGQHSSCNSFHFLLPNKSW